MDKLATAKVLIVGDIMSDSYWQGTTSRVSPEAPVPVVHIKQQYHKAGGAGNVALNIASLEGRAHLIAIIGDDEDGQSLRQTLDHEHIYQDLDIAASLPTVKKLRILSQNQQLLRADFEECYSNLAKNSLEQRFRQALPNCQAVVLSDYGKGTLSSVQLLIKEAVAADKLVLVDPKGSDFARYHGASLITPNYDEFVRVAGPCSSADEIADKARTLIATYDLGGLLITRGAQGMMLVLDQQPVVSVPALSQEVFDVTGAGDTVIGVMAMALAGGYDFVTSMEYANAAASVVVSKVGTATASPQELFQALHKTHHACRGVITATQAKQAIKVANLQGETVVMTNGCFDILHAGHVDYLQQAKKLGNRLLVAVNDDASVRRLKGEQRPINSLEQRMRVLSALEAVDWVVSFSEDTPANLICQLAPDILVKGKDYTVDQIAGADFVLQQGGEVKTIDLTPGCATSNVIARIRGE